MSQSRKTALFENVKNRDPVFTSRFHTDFGIGIFCKPGSQFSEPFGKGRKASLLILCMAIGIGNTDAGIDPGFVDIKATAVVAKNYKQRVPPVKKFAGLAGTGHPAKSSQLRKG